MFKQKSVFTFIILLFFLLFSERKNINLQPKKSTPPLISKNCFKPVTPTLEQIFSDNHDWAATLSARRKRTLMATGDVIPARSVNFKANQYKNFKWSFEKTASVLKSADITLINLESPLVENCPLTNTGMVFCGDPQHIKGLEFAGVDVANLANNHIENQGTKGVKSTITILEKKGILATGIAGPVFKNLKGLRFAFLGFDDTSQYRQLVATADEEKIVQKIKEAKQEADIAIVSFHWGVEYTRQPTTRQKRLAHLAIDSGADLIIGNHPHWLQPVEIYKDQLIIYAHGNFIFDQMWSEETKIGVVGRYTFYDDKLIDVEFLPIKILDYGQPYFLEGEEKEKILEDLKPISWP